MKLRVTEGTRLYGWGTRRARTHSHRLPARQILAAQRRDDGARIPRGQLRHREREWFVQRRPARTVDSIDRAV